MDLAEYHRGYRERLGRWMLNPWDLEALWEWLSWGKNHPGPAVVWGGA